MKLKLKICGMKYPENIVNVAKLQPDYLGFIFFPKSKRYFDGDIPNISDNIKKTGVFVNASIEFVIEKVRKYNLNTIQLHGDESPKYCADLQRTENYLKSDKRNLKQVQVIKVFSVSNDFQSYILNDYEDVCDYFLFDTKGKERGGNGIIFNWKLLNNYPSKKPYFLSGGIGLDAVEDIKEFLKSDASKYCYALDVNSMFEDKPGFKNIEDLKLFIQDLKI